MSEQWVSPIHTTSPKADYRQWGEIFREQGWLDPAAAAQLRAERDALLDLREKAQAWRALFTGPDNWDTGPWAPEVNALVAVVDALEHTEGARP